MVVECPECGTRFSLDESRITGATAKVRCSHCSQIFRINRAGQVVEKEAAPPAPPPEAPAEAPAEAPPETPPEERGEAPPEIPSEAPPETPSEAPEEGPPAERPSPRIVREEAPPPETEEPPPAGAGVEAREEEAVGEAPEGPLEEALAPARPRFRWWIVIIILAVPLLAALGWWLWQLQQPEPVGPPAGPAGPAPLVVTPSPPPIPAEDLQNLPVDWAQARYEGLVNAQGEQVLVIRGEVANEGEQARGPILLKATLTDARHQPLKEQTVYAGTTLTDEEVKTLDPDKIKAWLDQPGGRSQKQVLQKGEKQSFTVVFFGVPANLAETQAGFQLVVVEGPVMGDNSGSK